MCEYFPDSCGNCQPCVNQCPSDINICPQYPIPVCYSDPDDYVGSIGNPTNDSSASLLGQEDDTPKCINTRFLKVANPIYNNANKPKPFSQQGSSVRSRAGNRNSTGSGSGSGGPSRAFKRSGKTPGRTSTGKASLSSGGGGVGKSRKKSSRASKRSSRSRRSPKPLSLGKSTNRSARSKNKSRDKSLKGGKGSGKAKSKAKSRGRSGKSKGSSSRATSKGKSRSKSNKNSKERGRSSRRTGKLKPRGPPPTPVIDENKRRLQLLDLLERFNKYILETGIGSDDNTKVNLLRGYSSEPDVQLPCKTKFSFKGKKPRGKTAVQVSKSMDDVLLEKKGYLHLLNPNPYSDEDFKEINISSQTWKKWHDYFDLENKRYSFFDELFFKKYVTDSMEVPGKTDDISYLIEADSVDYRSKIDYGRVVLKTKHVYTGNFVDWYFQGPGRYVWLDGSVYQGDFVNGVMHGEGTLLWPNGSIYEGEFRHGVRGGSGVYTTSAGYVYSGEWLQGLPQGKGKLWYDPVGNAENFYEGDLIKGLPHGFGTRNYGSGDSYIGNWSNGQRDGHGTMLWRGQKQMYKGKWHKGHVHGKGIHAWFSSKPEQETVPEPPPRTTSSKKHHKHKQKQQPQPQPQTPQPTVFRHIFQGRWKKGARHGIGRLYYPNGSVYEGTWELGKQMGEGILQDHTGELLTGLQCSHAESTGFIENILDRTTCECLFSRLLTAVYKRVPLKLCENRRKDERELTNLCFDNMYQFKLMYQRAVDLGKMWSNFTPSSKTTHPSKRNPKCFQPARNYLSEFGNEHSMFSKFNNMETQNRDQIATRFGLWLLIKDMKNVGKQICMSTLDESWASMPSIGFQTLHSPFETVYFWQFVQCIVVLAFEFLVALPFEKSRAKYKCKREKEETEVEGSKSAGKIKKKRGGSSRSRGTSKNSGGSGSKGKSKKTTTNISKKATVPETANPNENPLVLLKTQSKSTPKSVLQVNLSDDDFIDVPNAAEDGMIGRHPSELIQTDEQTETDTDDLPRQDSSEEDIYEAFPSCGESICMGDLFKTFIIFELTPCFTNVAGKNLPQLPNSLPPIKDLFEMFRSVKNHDVITALDFLYIILPHRIFPDSHRDTIYWNRISEILSPKVDYDSIFRFVKEMESWEAPKPTQKPPRKQPRHGGHEDGNYNEDNWIESAEEFDNTYSNNVTNVNTDVKLDFNNNQKSFTDNPELNDTSEEDGIKYCQPSKPKTVKTQVEEISKHSAASEENPPGYKIYDEDGFPFIEFELMTPDSAPSSTEIPSDRIQLEKPRSLRNLGADDVVGVFRYMYPGLCGQPTETNLHFQMLFCDWLWCIILCTQVSIEKERLREGRVKSNEFHVSNTKNSVHNKNIEKLRCCQSKKMKGDALLQDHILNLFYKHQDLRRGEKWVSDNQSTNFQTVKSGNVGKNLASREEESQQGENVVGLKSSHEA